MSTHPFPVPAGWYILCRSSDIKRRPRRFVLAGVALVAFRTASGQPGVLADRCAHRGVPLSAGVVNGETVQCPYHGWQYDCSGKLTGVPALSPCGTGLPDLKIPHWATQEQDGFVWVWQGAEAPKRGPRPFAHLHEPGWTHFVMQTTFLASVQACLENFLDCPHATFVHRYWFRAPTQKPVKAIVTTLTDGAQAEFFEEPREKSVVWHLLAPPKGRMQHTDRFVAPHTSQVDYGFAGGLHYTITSVCSPVTETQTRVFTVISFRWRRLGWLRLGWLVRLFFEPLSRWIIRQDVAMLALQQRNLVAPAIAPPGVQPHPAEAMHSTNADLLGPHIAAWRKALLLRTAPPLAGQEKHVEIYL